MRLDATLCNRCLIIIITIIIIIIIKIIITIIIISGIAVTIGVMQ